jgi:uncharacterized protein YkwD
MQRACLHISVLALVVSCAFPLGTGTASAQAPCPQASAMPSQVQREPVIGATLCLINQERDKQGLAPLRISDRLGNAAQAHAKDMAKRNYFSHTSQSGASFVDRIRRTGYLANTRSWQAAENIAWGTGRLATPKAIVRSWMNSPGHRMNILSGSLREIGIGIAKDAPIANAGPGGTYATDFGTRG